MDPNIMLMFIIKYLMQARDELTRYAENYENSYFNVLFVFALQEITGR